MGQSAGGSGAPIDLDDDDDEDLAGEVPTRKLSEGACFLQGRRGMGPPDTFIERAPQRGVDLSPSGSILKWRCCAS